MREYSYAVRVERHAPHADVVALTFSKSGEGEGLATTPLVFVLHGLGSRKERHLDLCLRLAEAGFRAVVLDAPCHGDRRGSSPGCDDLAAADRSSEPFLRAFLETIHGTVRDVQAVARYFKALTYGVVGHSMGGHTALHLALADPRASVIVNISGSLYLGGADASGADRLYSAALRDALNASDPVPHAAQFAPRPLLLLHGENDKTVPVRGARRLYDALQPFYAETSPDACSLVELPDIGHQWVPEMAEQTIEWLNRHLHTPKAISAA